MYEASKVTFEENINVHKKAFVHVSENKFFSFFLQMSFILNVKTDLCSVVLSTLYQPAATLISICCQ